MEAGSAIRTGERPRPAARALPPPSSLPPALLGRDPALLRVLDTALRLAPWDQPLLLAGETGTGKELLARTVHHGSRRAGGPFVAVNCAAVPAGILEAEVFGAAAGAFTGAGEGRPGLLEAAHGGTLFLDEIGDMPPGMQAALLRALEDGTTRRLGETAERRTDFRLLAATHRDLGALVASGRFRPDLLYRLGRVLRLPPLRERPDDAVLLARAFLLEAAGGGAPPGLSPCAEEWIRAHPFPGNVRELRSRAMAAAALCEGGVVRREDLAGDEGPGASPWPAPPRADGTGERVLEALRRRDRAAVALLVRETGLPRRTVQRALAGLVRGGGLVREGRGPATRYSLPTGAGPAP